jgi:hypothetical protein
MFSTNFKKGLNYVAYFDGQLTIFLSFAHAGEQVKEGSFGHFFSVE